MLYQHTKFCCLCGGSVVSVPNNRKQCTLCSQRYHPNPWPIVLVVAYEASGWVILTRHEGLAEATWKLIGGYITFGASFTN
jgi:NADH pyrophosphatase NudC (nudix superfamily)